MRRKEVEQNVAEERFEEELATPAAEQERQRSRTEFAHANASEASNLLDAEFGSVIEMLNEDPGRLLTRLKVEKMLGPYAARVSLPVTGREIVESGLPLVSALGDGDSMPVDLTLERSGGTFSPANPTSPTQLPATADGPIEVGDGVHVQMPASRDHEAVQVGQMSLFYPETETTTDTMLAPVAGGAEVFEQLRSAESPEELRFAVETPDGGHLTATPGGGAEILDSGGTGVEEVAPPTAIDAQGASVPTTMSVEGDSLVLDVELAATQPAYPVLVDPLFLEEPTSFGEWAFENVGAEYGHTWDASKLEVWSLGGGHLYPAETHGAFTYATPGETAWIEAATFRSISFFPNSCGGNQPHGYLGLYNPGAGRWEKLGVWEGLTPTGGDEWQTGWVGQPGTRWAVFGVGTNGIGASNTCVHEFYLGNYSLQEKDTTSPVITSVTGVPLDRWFDPETVGEASFAAADSGFGVFEISTGNGAAQPVGARPPGSGAGCTGVSGNRCPHEFTFQIKPAYERGKREFHVWAKDAMGNEATPFSGETWVDVERPAIELRGQFARATEEVGFSDQGAGNPADENKLRLPTYELQINATDGSNAEPGTMQSGVQGVEVLLDGKEQPLAWGTQKCPASESSCSLSGLYELQLPGLSAGVHELKAVATDRVGLSRERKIEFEYIPATGEGENQVLEHFPLPDGEAQDETGEEPTGAEVAVNVINGNLVFHQRDAEVASADAALPIQRTYNSELPQGQSSEFGSGWTLGDAPEIEGSGGGRATLVQGDGTMETAVMLPTQEGHQAFDPSTHAAIEKVPDGYAVIDEGESATPTADVAPTGLTNDLQGSAGATLDLEREGGELSELVADDPASASGKAEQSVTELPVGYMFEGSFGAPRPPDVEALSEPDATATDAEGDVWVADAGHDRVVEFDAEGGFVRQFGSTGTGPGEFSALHGIAAISGDVFVADADRIEEFDSTGGFVRQWSMESEGNTTEIVGVGIDPAGYLRVLDYPGDVGASMRMSTFTVEGALLQTVKTQAMAVLRPTGFAIDATGNIWVSDGIANRVAELSPSGFIQRVIGKEGSAPGQLFQPGGVAIDAAGHIWVADTGNDRLEEFSPAGAYLAVFGAGGSEDGQFSEPRAIAIDPNGNIWAADTGNDRVQEVAGGNFVRACGAPRPPDVEALSEPDATATDAEGDVWVADAGHDRVVEFDAEGGFVRQFGSTGTGPGEFSALHGIAAISGDVFVADADRIEEFDSTGGFVRQWSMESEGNTTEIVGVGIDPAGYLRVLDYPGDVGASMRMSTFTVEGALLQTVKTQAMAVLRPTGFAIDATGNIWVSDGIANRVAELSPSGFIQRVIGKEGSAPGQLFQPGGVAIDAAGHIWVADTGNDRLEEFSPAGAFLGRFGRPGGDEGLLSDPDGFSLSSSGVFWVADTGNDRLEKWVPSEPSPAPPAEPAPAASVETSDGLIESIEGDPTGILSYNHDGTQLTAVEGPGASTAYGYDPDGRLNLIELTHGTCVEVGYDAVGRVVKLTISVEGGLPEVTYFEYPVVPNEPVTRETVVRRPSKPATYYSISEEGSVLRWWYSATPPEIEEPTGSLWDQRGEVHSGTVTIGDQDLILNAASPHGIESILLVANGSGVVAERVCAEEHPWECSTLRLAYHTETGGWPPGVLSLEVVVKDAVGGASSLRFWDDIPYTPPPNDPELESPKYEEVLRFREEFGLDLDLKGNERAIEERIFNLIDAWHEPTPEGQVARASKERWGVPLRAIDVAELEYREWFYGVNAEKIDDWVEETQPGNFGGFYLAPQPGGIMYVGFLGNQEEELEHLKSSLSLVAQDRLRVYPVAPTVAYLAARAKTPSVTEAIESSQALRELVVDVREEEGGGGIQVGTPEVAKVARLLQEAVPGAPVNVVRESRGGRVLSGRFRNTGRMRAGDAIFNFIPGYGTEDCTAGFGAKERTGTLRGKATWALFTLTAGHCRESPAAPEFYRSTEVTPQPDKGTWSGIGTMSRDAWYAGGLVRTDAGAIETTESGLIPHGIFGERGELIPIRSAETAKIGGTLCYSGARTRVPSCGKVVARSVDWHNEAGSNEADRGGYWVRFTSPAQKGDSGAPVYDVFGHGVGMVTACRPVPDCSETLVEPLLHPLHMPADAVPGVLENPNLGQLSLAVGR